MLSSLEDVQYADMETAILRSLSVGRLHFQQSGPIAGQGLRDIHHAATGGCAGERHAEDVSGKAAIWGRARPYLTQRTALPQELLTTGQRCSRVDR